MKGDWQKNYSRKMNALRVWYWLAALFVTFYYGSSLELHVCPDSRVNFHCNMTCTTDNFLQTIEFRLNGTLRGSCTTAFGCGPNLQQQATDKTILTIPSLSYLNDIGNWTCSYGPDVTSTYLIVYGNPSPPNITLQTNLDANAENVENVEFTAVLECAYPSTPSVILEFAEVGKGTYQTFKSVQPSISAPTAGQCTDNLESIVTAEIKASYDENDGAFAGKTGRLRAKFFYTSDVEFITSSIGPFKFKACTSSFPCGFLPVWLILILIDVVICILVWKKVLKIGGFFKKKKIIIAIFIGVAIVAMVIGVILGIYMKCPNCGITVVASVAIGLFIAIVQWIFIMFWICKKEFYRAVIKITGETKYTDELGDCKSEAYKNLSDRVIKAIESLYENVEGRQTVMDINFSPGLKVTFDLSSQGFSDCSVLSDTLENALQKGVISSFKVSSVGFEFMPLQDWKDSKGETSDRSNGDRARSPASASAIKVEAENKSHIKPTGKKTEESSLHIKSYGSPLPEVPKVRHNQLDPIPKSDNGEMDNSHNKPYTKLPEVPQGRSIPLVPIQGQDIDEMESPKVEKKKKKKKKKRREDSVDNEEDN